MGADPLPKTAQELKEWVNSHPDLADSKALREAIEFLKILRFQNRVNRVPHTAACCSNNYRTRLTNATRTEVIEIELANG